MSIVFLALWYTFFGVINKMKPLKEKISITIDADLLELLRVKAEDDDRSLSQYINLILKMHLKNDNNEKKSTS